MWAIIIKGEMNYSLLHVSKCYSHDFMTIHDSFEHMYRYHYLSKNEDMMFGIQTISWQLPYFNQGKYNIFLLDSLSRPFWPPGSILIKLHINAEVCEHVQSSFKLFALHVENVSHQRKQTHIVSLIFTGLLNKSS